VLDFEPVELHADAAQKTRFSFGIENTKLSEPGFRHRTNKMTFPDARAAANRHHQALLPRHAAQWIDFWSVWLFHKYFSFLNPAFS
jgi:hypothetical protein